MRRAPKLLLGGIFTLAGNAAPAVAATRAVSSAPSQSRSALSFSDLSVYAPAAGGDYDSGDSGSGGSVVA